MLDDMHLNIADVSLSWRDEHVALQVIPNFTPQHFSSIPGMGGCAAEKGKAVYAMKNSF